MAERLGLRRSSDGRLSRREREIATLVAEGLTNREIGRRLFIAQRTAEGHVEQILGKLGFHSRAQVAAWVVRSSFADAPPSATQPPPGNLPADLTRLIDRQDELGQLRDLQPRSRLLTITGPGGCGKSRLALSLARDVATQYERGAWFVDLGLARQAAHVDLALAECLGIVEAAGEPLSASVAAHLRKGASLLVLDTCEHIAEPIAATVLALLRACPKLAVIATSREPLRISGEALFRLYPMELPAGDGVADLDAIANSPAVQLFEQRAAEYVPGFRLDAGNAAAISSICNRLDGLPLAIELAASGLQMLSLAHIDARLVDPLARIGDAPRDQPDRQRGLERTIRWSYELLSEQERSVFQWVSIFAGGFDLAAAAAVCAPEILAQESTAELLAKLVARSLVVAEAGQYRQLDTIREFGCRLLREEGGADRAYRRLASHCLTVLGNPAGAMTPAVGGFSDTVLAHTETALDWCEAADPALGLQLTVACAEFWITSGYPSAPRARLETLLGCVDSLDVGLSLLSRARLAIGKLAYVQGDLDEAARRAKEGMTNAAVTGDLELFGLAETLNGVLALSGGLTDDARAAFERALAAAREDHDPRAEALNLHHLGSALALAGDVPLARTLLLESVAIRRKLGESTGLLLSYTFLAGVDLLALDLEAARAWLRQCVELARTTHDRRIAYSLEVLAAICVADAEHRRALMLAGAAAALRANAGWWGPPSWTSMVDRALEPARHALGVATTTETCAAGSRLDFEAILDVAATALSLTPARL